MLDGPSLLCSHHNKGRFGQNLRGNFNEEQDTSMVPKYLSKNCLLVGREKIVSTHGDTEVETLRMSNGS